MSVEASIDVRANGSGVVRAAVGLDDEALAQVADLASELRLDDLTQAGWNVDGPARADDGLTWVRASKPFEDPSEAEQVMTELAGRDGPFRDFRVTRSRSLARTQTSFTGLVDLSSGLGAFSDPDLRQRLGGVDVAAQVPPESIGVSVTVRLPGAERAEGGEPLADGVLWRAELGQQQRLDAHSSAFEPVPVVPGTISVLAAGLALAVVLRRRRTPRLPVPRPPLPPDWPIPD